MRIGIPTEIKLLEGRVGLVPEACDDLVRDGHELFIQAGAGEKSGYPDEAYRVHGVAILPDAAALYERAELIVKVKEPVAGDLEYLRRNHLLFCYLHLAANPELARTLQRIGLTAVAFETVQDAQGGLPLLAPMSDIAGRIAVQSGATLLQQPQGGRGVLLGGVPAAERGQVVVLGAGHAGGNAAKMAAGIGALVTVFDKQPARLAAMRAIGPNVSALYPYPSSVQQAVQQADLLIGAVLIPGARTPHLVSREDVSGMLPGSVIVDISVDQGGCIETTRPTDYAAPTFVEEGVVHYGVTNMPGAVPRSASQALSASLLPYVRKLAGSQWWDDPELTTGINLHSGDIVHPAVKESLE